MEKISSHSPLLVVLAFTRAIIYTHTCKMSTFSFTDDDINNNSEDFLTLYVDYMSQPSRACAIFVRYDLGARLVSFLFTTRARDELHAHFSLVT